MEDQGTIKPAGTTTQVQFRFGREAWFRSWGQECGSATWIPANPAPQWVNDQVVAGPDTDESPSSENHIYQIDAPGFPWKEFPGCRAVQICDYKDSVVIYLDGSPYQCSDFAKWHSQIYLKRLDPDPNVTIMTRDANNLLGAGWIPVPETP